MAGRTKFDRFDRGAVRLFSLGGPIGRMAEYPIGQLTDRRMWKRCVDQFRGDYGYSTDMSDEGWRGEYWGKLMRGGAMTLFVTGSDELYEALKETAEDMLTAQDAAGRFSTYSPDREFRGWDIWCRKYVMLGFLSFLNVCRDPALSDRIIEALKKHADYIIDKIGPGKPEIYDTSDAWRGVNSSSILEPFVLLYNVTSETRYLDFAKYIVSSGMIQGGDLLALIEDPALMPYRFEVTKAYEVMSCVEGLLELGLTTGDRRLIKAAAIFADKVLESDFTVVGGAGCTHELFDNSTRRQTERTEGIKQETCVTVTLMKLLSRVYAVTGDEKYLAAVERSAFNALYGACNMRAVNVNGGLTFDSYSPLIGETRAQAIGGLKTLCGVSFNGCCNAIGAAGTALLPRLAVTADSDAVYINTYAPMLAEIAADRGIFGITVETDYPYGGHVKLIFTSESDEIRVPVRLRIPAFVPRAYIEADEVPYHTEGYAYFELRGLEDGSIVTVDMEMPVTAEEDETAGRFSVSRGPIVYAAEGAFAADDLSFPTGFVSYHRDPDDPSEKHEILLERDDERLVLTDYAHAGDDWRTPITVWIKSRGPAPA